MSRKAKEQADQLPVGVSLAIGQLVGLSSELQLLRDHPPLVKRSDGKYEGDILGFVKGLHLSARVIYFLRERLSSADLEVSWGHILDQNGQSCSPECDVVIHKKGWICRWNGSSRPIMEFTFVEASSVLAVISCKSKLTTIDKKYPSSLKKYGVNKVFLLAECCVESRKESLKKRAREAGYKGLWFLYSVDTSTGFVKTDESALKSFVDEILKSVSSRMLS
ncbi:MAG: hypothetical protein OXL95_07465 [Nitrospira sp.]|nr:hypothetical protein [Nitrospira sp.]